MMNTNDRNGTAETHDGRVASEKAVVVGFPAKRRRGRPAKNASAFNSNTAFRNVHGVALVQSDAEYLEVLEKIGLLYYSDDNESRSLLESYRAVKNEWEQRREKQAIDRGDICSRCKVNAPSPGHKRCFQCRDYSNKFTRSRRERFVQDGVCMECGAPPDPCCRGKIKYCSFHLSRRNEMNRQRYAAKKSRGIVRDQEKK